MSGTAPGHRRRLPAWILPLAVVVTVPVLWALTRQPAPKPRNVILISIDTLRADHLSYAGYKRPTSPAIDRLAAQSLDFRRAFSQAPSTLPSHATMFTSVYPSVHGAETRNTMPLPEGQTTLAEHFRNNGFRTAAFVEGGQVAAIWNLDQGFEVYDDPTQEMDLTGYVPDVLDVILDRATHWIEQHRNEKFFCFIHSYVVHHPYTPRPPYDRMFDEGYDGPLPFAITDELRSINATRRYPDEPDVRHVVSLYDGEIRYMDELVGRFLDWMRETSLDDETVVVFTSDHGEEFAEHGQVGVHSHTLADELLHVPLLIRVPGLEPRTVRRQVRLLDLEPTLLALMDIDVGSEVMQGRNLLADGPDSEQDLPVFSEMVYPTGHWISLRYPDRKIIARPGTQSAYYDLTTDPLEQHNIFSPQSAESRELLKEVQAINARNDDFAHHLAVPVKLDKQAEAQLRALGYFD
jgi:arylsulfatase A-like enzyme